MTYIVTRRFKAKTMSGIVNLPYGTACELKKNTIYYNNKPLCFSTSENAHKYFARDDDGNGKQRGELTHEIMRILQKNQPAWDRIWGDLSVRKYKRKEHENHWLWNHDFYNAPIDDLKYILKLAKGK